MLPPQIDSTLLTGPMKSWILKRSVGSKVALFLLVHGLPLTHINSWRVQFHQYVKKWLVLENSTEPSIIYCSHANFGVHLLDIREFATRLQPARMYSVKYSPDTKNAEALRLHPGALQIP